MIGNCNGCSKHNTRVFEFGTEVVCTECYFSDDLIEVDP